MVIIFVERFQSYIIFLLSLVDRQTLGTCKYYYCVSLSLSGNCIKNVITTTVGVNSTIALPRTYDYWDQVQAFPSIYTQYQYSLYHPFIISFTPVYVWIVKNCYCCYTQWIFVLFPSIFTVLWKHLVKQKYNFYHLKNVVQYEINA